MLGCMQGGDARAAEEVLPLVYNELRRLAAHKLANEPPGQTLQATALVHEAWLKLQSLGKEDWQSRTQFFNTAAEAMRRILVDKARRKRAQRRGGGVRYRAGATTHRRSVGGQARLPANSGARVP